MAAPHFTGNVLITGASSGIGLACAKQLAGLGYRVLAGVRSAPASDAIRGTAPGVTPVMLDVCEPSSILEAVRALDGAPLAGLINNAGIAAVGPLEMVSLDAWRRQFDVNVIGLVAVTQACLPQLRLGKGRIVNVGSIAGRSAMPCSAAYDATKFAMEAISDALRMELGSFGINVSLVEPGAIATGMWQKALADLDMRQNEVAPDRRELYRDLISKTREEITHAPGGALPPEAVADVVVHAMTAPRPKTRYVVGRDARLELLMNLLPDRVRDWLILKDIGDEK
jgi:NAD(P)-dependent dehydrogenase (short-subunit alcohol dehydrogenase family)